MIIPIVQKFDIEVDEQSNYTKVFNFIDPSTGLPVDLTPYRADMQVRSNYEGAQNPEAVLGYSSDEGGGIVLGGVAGTITLNIGFADTANLYWTRAVYDLFLTPTAGGSRYKFVKGLFTVDYSVTREQVTPGNGNGGGGGSQVNSDWNATTGVARILNKPYVVVPNVQNPGTPGYREAAYTLTNVVIASNSPVILTMDGGSANVQNQISLPDNSIYSIEIIVNLFNRDTGLGYWVASGQVSTNVTRGVGTSTVSLLNDPGDISIQDNAGSGISIAAANVAANPSTGGLTFTVTKYVPGEVLALIYVKTVELVTYKNSTPTP